MDPKERELLIEAALSAHRARDPRGVLQPSPAFFDLDEAARRELYDEALALRTMEALLDPEGRSSTVRSVLEAIRTADGRR